MNNQVRPTGRKRGGSSFGSTMAVPAVVKAVCGTLLAVLIVVVWQQFVELEERQKLSAHWESVEDYAVFYPRLLGNDRDELETGSNASTISEARDLYPVLDKAGALYIDAINYEPGAPWDPSSPWPAPPIRVNANYLEQYPIMDDTGTPIHVEDDEQAWVVVVPEQFKSREAQLKEFLQKLRTGGQGYQGAVQAQERMLRESVPEQFSRQQVRIIWMASGQDVFAFNSRVNPNGGNMIKDPVIEVMTPANSLVVDRLNSITGEMNTPLKVRVDGSPAAILNELAPMLKELKLDDNLQYLVTGQEAMIAEVSDIRSGITWVAAFAGGALLVLLVLNATLVIIASDRLRRRLIVRRLHGVGLMSSYRELLVVLGVTWLAQTLLAGALVVLLKLKSMSMPGVDVNIFAQLPKLLAVVAASLVIEALFVFVTASMVERRNAVKQLKEL